MNNHTLLQTHEYLDLPPKPIAQPMRARPYLRLSRGAGSSVESIFIKAGGLYTEDGQPCDAPSWFLDEVKKCTARALEEVGYTLPEESNDPNPEEAA